MTNLNPYRKVFKRKKRIGIMLRQKRRRIYRDPDDVKTAARMASQRKFKEKLASGEMSHLYLGGTRRKSRVKVTLPAIRGSSDDTG